MNPSSSYSSSSSMTASFDLEKLDLHRAMVRIEDENEGEDERQEPPR